MPISVHKFGGAALADISSIKESAEIVARRSKEGNALIVAVSAMRGETDRLKRLAYDVSEAPPPREIDMLVSAGERVSMSLFTMALCDLGIPSRSFTGSQSGILTDNCHGNAKIERILGDRIRDCLNDGNVAIVAGFQGMNLASKEITTLGRGGTDLTALALAHCFQAHECVLYKDVNGILDVHPKLAADGKVLAQISWDEMVELSWSGAGIVHARAAELAKKFSIPFWIRPFHQVKENGGTLIEGEAKLETFHLSSIAYQDRMSFVELDAKTGENDFLDNVDQILKWLWNNSCSPSLLETNHTSAGWQTRMLIPSNLGEKLPSQCESMASAVKVSPGYGLVTLVGSGFKQNPGVVSSALQALNEPPKVFSMGHSSLSICLQEANLENSIKKLRVAMANVEG